MSRHYTHVPQAPLIEAINKLPTIREWLDQDWMREPVKLVGRRAKTLKKAERQPAKRRSWSGSPTDRWLDTRACRLLTVKLIGYALPLVTQFGLGLRSTVQGDPKMSLSGSV